MESRDIGLSSGIRELFRVGESSLCTGGIFALSGLRNNFVHTSMWSWSSTHHSPGKGMLTQLSSGEYANITVYLDITSTGDVIICADVGGTTPFSISVSKYAGSNIDFSSANADRTSAAAGYVRHYTQTTASKSFITNTGVFQQNVGIGTTNPVAKLHVRVGTNANFAAQLTNSITQLQSINDAGNSFTRLDIAGSEISLSPSSTEAVRINSSGNVGIGTTNPTAKLDVNGFAKASNFISTSYSVFGSIVAADPGSNYYSWNNRIGGGLAVVGTTYLDGNVGIGTTNPSSPLEVQSSTVSKIISNYNNSKHIGMSVGGSGGGFTISNGHFLTINHQPYADRGTDANLTERVRITSNGNVGIGTNNPDTNLHIQRASVQGDANGILKIESTNDSSGAATNASLIAKNKFGFSQFMQWENHGLRIGSRGISNGGSGSVHFTYGNDTNGLILHQDGRATIGGLGGLTLFTQSAFVQGDQTFSVNFTWYNGAIWVICFGSHWSQGYEVIRRAFLLGDGYNGLSIIDDYSSSTAPSGSWAFSRPANHTLRITKTAGNYIGGMQYQILIFSPGTMASPYVQ